MAVGMSQRHLDSFVFPNFFLNHLLIRCYSLRYALRRGLLGVDTKAGKKTNLNMDFTRNFEATAEFFRKNHWAFVENVLPQEAHQELIDQWPGFFHFKPVKSIYKSYDIGFIDPGETYSRCPALQQLSTYLASEKLLSRLNNYALDGVSERSVGSVVFSRARYSSSCLNHLDSVSESGENTGKSINLILFVDGTGGRRSGGTCIYRDKDGEIVFEPTNLTNTLLIYRSDITYHGFPAMRLGSFRWMVTCHAINREIPVPD